MQLASRSSPGKRSWAQARQQGGRRGQPVLHRAPDPESEAVRRGPSKPRKLAQRCARRPLHHSAPRWPIIPKSRVRRVRAPHLGSSLRTGVAQRPRTAGRRAFPHSEHEGGTAGQASPGPTPEARQGQCHAHLLRTTQRGGAEYPRRNRSQDRRGPIRRWRDLRVRGNPGSALQTPVTQSTAPHHVLQPSEGLCWALISGRMRMQEGQRKAEASTSF